MSERGLEQASLPAPPPVTSAEKGFSLWQDAWRRLRRNRMAMSSLYLLLLLVLFSIAGPWLSPHELDAIDLEYGARSPTWTHPMGTDISGRDQMTRIMHGGRLSLAVGIVATLVSFIIGVTYGAVAGYSGGRADNLMMRFVDVMYAIPYMFLVVILLVMVDGLKAKTGIEIDTIYLLFIALGAVQWLTMARIVRGQVLSLRKKEFVEAAHSIGVSNASIIFRHLVPNALGPIIVYSTLTVPAVMLEEAFLSFLGLGVQAPKASWGTLIADGAQAMSVFPWLIVFPGLFLGLTLFSLNFLGDGLRDALDPQSRKY
jgi:oligopeptide transport system permease protein